MTTPLLRSLRSPSSDAATYKRKRPRKFAGWLGLAVLAAAALRNNSSLRTSVEAFVPGQKFVSSVPKRDSSSSSFSPVAASSASLALASAFYSDATTATSSSSSHLAPVRPHRPSVSSLPMTSPRSSTGGDNASPKPPTEFELGVGRALDTLRRDYPTLLDSHPDYTIYRRDISIVDPSGVHVHGLTAYKNAFRLLHAVVKLVYCIDRSSLNFKLCYDTARHNIRIHWHAIVVPREIFGGIRTTLHVDGISVYELDPNCGNVTEHRIEQLLINDQPIVPEEGLIAALQDRHLQGVGSAIPTFSSVLEFRSFAPLGPLRSHGSPSLLFAWEGMEQSPSGTAAAAAQPSSSSNAHKQHHHQHQQQHAYRPAPSQHKAASASGGGTKSTTASSSSSSSPTQAAAALAADTTAAASAATTANAGTSPMTAASSAAATTMDWTKFEQKNQSRKKFGLKPLTVEEFLDLERQVAELDAQQRQKMAAQSASARDEAAQTPSGPNLWDKIFGTVLKDTCESNFDCERPEICCDFGFKKMCCASGTPVGSSVPQYAYVPVPVDVGPIDGGGAGGWYPR